MRAGEQHMLTQEIREVGAWRYIAMHWLAIDGERDLHAA
jgi:hypothetical protein